MGNRLTKIFTKKGDDGTTDLGGNNRVEKFDSQIIVYGDLDELSAAIGLITCQENIPSDIDINTNESGLRSLDIYPYKPIPSSKESYAIVLKVFNPRKSGLYQFHSYGQPKGKSVSSYLGSWTIVID